VAANTSRGKSMLAQYSVPIMDTPIEHAAAQELPVQSDFEQMDFALTEQEVEVIRTRVLRRCALSSRVAKNKLPWYFHYEFGVDLMEAGDARMALDALTLGANKREDSRRDSRMYGMWYIDYLPYYQIALANARLGNWENARNAIELSNAFGEFSPEDVDFESFAQLEKLIAQKIEGGGS
jgi:hypothetical protein